MDALAIGDRFYVPLSGKNGNSFDWEGEMSCLDNWDGKYTADRRHRIFTFDI